MPKQARLLIRRIERDHRLRGAAWTGVVFDGQGWGGAAPRAASLLPTMRTNSGGWVENYQAVKRPPGKDLRHRFLGRQPQRRRKQVQNGWLMSTTFEASRFRAIDLHL